MLNNLAVLFSGGGSLFKAMVDDKLPISLAVADRQCGGIDIAQTADTPCILLNRADFGQGKSFRRDEYTRQVVSLLQEHQIQWVAMAGYMTVFGQPMFEAYADHIINTHPALLPAFKGEKAVADALAFGVKVTGCTMHFATIKLDDGPILAQEAVRVEIGDTVDTLWERIKKVERVLYPKLLRQLMGLPATA